MAYEFTNANSTYLEAPILHGNPRNPIMDRRSSYGGTTQ
jgi:hypothetical protein